MSVTSVEHLKTFKEIYPDMISQTTVGVVDNQATIGEILTGYKGGRTIATDGGDASMSGSAAEQLFRMVGLDARTINKFDRHPDLQRAMLMAAAEDKGAGDKTVIARGAQKGSNLTYHAFVTEDYLPVNNGQLITALHNELPDGARVHKASIRNRELMLRIVHPDWYHDLGGGDPALTAIVVRNSEIGQGALSVRTGVSRLACWNTVLSEHPVFEHNHRFLLYSDMERGFRDAIQRLQEVATVVAAALKAMKDVGVSDVQAMMRAMSGEMGLPSYVQEGAIEWWKANGEIPNLFSVAQALTFGVQKMSGRKNPQWDRREQIEYQVYEMASTFSETGELKLCECPSCHRPLREYVEDGDIIDGEFTVND